MKTSNNGSMKDFFINHTEKIVFGIFVLLFLLIVWQGFMLKPMSITPQELKNSVAQGQQKLDTSKPDTTDLKAEDFFKKVKEKNQAVSKEALALLDVNQNFRHAIAQPQVKRQQPPVLPLVGLQATSGAGFCPDIRSDTSSRSSSKDKNVLKAKPGVRWIIVTALIPYEEQEKKFTETFKNADVQYPETDKPLYYSYYAERQEITENGPQDWKPVELKDMFSLNKQYSSGSAALESVEQKYLLAVSNQEGIQPADAVNLIKPYPMAMSLMNLSKHQWGADGAHIPEIPADALKNLSPPNPGAEGEDGANAQAPVAASNSGNQATDKLPPYRLFRFIDTNIESGKKYRYRFKLVLKNPNYAVKPEYVNNESLTKNPVIESDWCEASPVAEVPLDIRLYCVGARVPKKESRENKTPMDKELGPEGRMMILKFDEAGGMEISKVLSEQIVQPGNVLNVYQVTNYENGTDLSKKRPADFKTDNIVLDFSAMEKPAGFNSSLPTPPARVLIMDKSGRILALSEIADKPAIFQKSKKAESVSQLSIGEDDSDSGTNKPGKKKPIQSKKPRGGGAGGIFDD